MSGIIDKICTTLTDGKIVTGVLLLVGLHSVATDMVAPLWDMSIVGVTVGNAVGVIALASAVCMLKSEFMA
mgnify:CR=1 FL=1